MGFGMVEFVCFIWIFYIQVNLMGPMGFYKWSEEGKVELLIDDK